MYIYIYIYRERERERERAGQGSGEEGRETDTRREEIHISYITEFPRSVF